MSPPPSPPEPPPAPLLAELPAPLPPLLVPLPWLHAQRSAEERRSASNGEVRTGDDLGMVIRPSISAPRRRLQQLSPRFARDNVRDPARGEPGWIEDLVRWAVCVSSRMRSC